MKKRRFLSFPVRRKDKKHKKESENKYHIIIRMIENPLFNSHAYT